MALLHRIQARDRALYEGLLLPAHGSDSVRRATLALTHMGGATATVAVALLPFVISARWHGLGVHAMSALALSHLVAQVVKRTVGRPRPTRGEVSERFIEAPDRFSFPSGHATASMAVALAYAAAMPMPCALTSVS